jgi:hypothetical protein
LLLRYISHPQPHTDQIAPDRSILTAALCALLLQRHQGESARTG